MITVITRHRYPHSDLAYSFPRNATPNTRARHVSTRTGLSNASTKSLGLSPIPPVLPNSYSGTSLAPRVPRMSPHEGPGLLQKWHQNFLSQHILSPSLLNQDPMLFRPLARLFVPPVAIAHHPVHRTSPDLTRPVMLEHTALPELHSPLSPYFPLSYSPRSLLSPTFHYHSWHLNDSNSPM